MIGSLSYEQMSKLANDLASSSSTIRQIIEKYSSEQVNEIYNFCDILDSYSRFLLSYVDLYKDSDAALKYMIDKNKELH